MVEAVCPPIWSGAESFRKRLNDLLVRAREGDSATFWQLCWDLQVDPSTGAGFRRNDEDVLRFPSVIQLDGDAASSLAEAAVTFLSTEHDRRGSWFGTATFDKRAWAGYLALALLDGRGELDAFDEEVWSRWSGAVIWFPAVPSNAGDRFRKTQILERAATVAPESFAEAVVAYVRGEVGLGHSPSVVTLLNPNWSRALSEGIILLVGELREQLSGSRRPRRARVTALLGALVSPVLLGWLPLESRRGLRSLADRDLPLASRVMSRR